MRKDIHSKAPYERPAQAEHLTKALLSQMKIPEKQHVPIDDDFMENIDSYWKLANKELEKMGEEEFEDISEAADPYINPKPMKYPMKIMDQTKKDQSIRRKKEEEKRISMSEEEQAQRRSFDKEFQANITNAVLYGFSDSEEEQKNPQSIDTSEEEDLHSNLRGRRMSFMPEPVAIKDSAAPEKKRGRGRPRKEETQKIREIQKKKKSLSVSGRGRKRKEPESVLVSDLPLKKRGRPAKINIPEKVSSLGDRKKMKKMRMTKGKEKEKEKVAVKKSKTKIKSIINTREVETGTILQTETLFFEKITIFPGKRKLLQKNSVYYLLKGSLILEGTYKGIKERTSFTYRNKEYTGIQIKSGNGFLAEKEEDLYVYNGGVYESQILGFKAS
ncbi:hypothetical protein NEFER03_0381 [Nematocida sp. LUAm3]|nr:hypothetical protein NEFER03_0381 [Nematocida sp. LUAm3]KAI5176003.1 hypothetical protein NEFER02_1849 [Nematocida sp. LUAm2]KAI5179100.1 hypothetical protein NEFER01_1967 [Nematocida sp. LUAm1]